MDTLRNTRFGPRLPASFADHFGGIKMALITRNHEDLHEKAMRENAVAATAELRALLEYLAMMCDVELPDNSAAEEEEEEEEEDEDDE
jgi:hypothetical protein